MTLSCPTWLGHRLGQLHAVKHGGVHLKWVRDPSTGHARHFYTGSSPLFEGVGSSNKHWWQAVEAPGAPRPWGCAGESHIVLLCPHPSYCLSGMHQDSLCQGYHILHTKHNRTSKKLDGINDNLEPVDTSAINPKNPTGFRMLLEFSSM